MPKFITDFETWLLDYGDRIYRYLVYKNENYYYRLCKITEAIDLGNGDWMLGLRTVDDDGKVCGMIHYYKLSEIRLALLDDDQCIELYENKEEDCDDEL